MNRKAILLLIFIGVLFTVGQTFAAPVPVAYWKFDEGSGTTIADSVGSNTATLIDGTWSSDVPIVPFTNVHSISFDGIDDYVLRSGVVTTATDNVTLAAWVKWQGPNNAGGIQAVVYNGNTATSGYGIYMDNNGDVSILIGGVTFIGTDVTLTVDNKWHHIAAERNNGTWLIYLDGVQQNVTSANTATPYVPLGNLTIGARTTGDNEFFHGLIDDVRIYDQALSAADIQALITVDPAAVPTINQWGALIFMLIAGLGSLYRLKRSGK